MKRKKKPVPRDNTASNPYARMTIDLYEDESEWNRIAYRLKYLLYLMRERKAGMKDAIIALDSYGLILRYAPPPTRPDDLPVYLIHDSEEKVQSRSTYRSIAQSALELGLMLAMLDYESRDFRLLWAERRKAKTAGNAGGKAKQTMAAKRKPEILAAFADWVHNNPEGTLNKFVTEFAARKKSLRGFSIRSIRGVVDQLARDIHDHANAEGFRGLVGARRIDSLSRHLEGRPGVTPATIRFLLR